MFIIPGNLIAIITFPGVIVHELAHLLFCKWCGISVYEVKYFQTATPNGYVIHERTDSPIKNLLTAMGPFFVNTLLGTLILMPAVVCVQYGSTTDFVSFLVEGLNLILIWIGGSILMHAFPSSGDAKSLVASIMKNPAVAMIWKVIAAPFIGLIYIGSIGSMVWLDLLYAVAIGLIAPKIFLLF